MWGGSGIYEGRLLADLRHLGLLTQLDSFRPEADGQILPELVRRFRIDTGEAQNRS